MPVKAMKQLLMCMFCAIVLLGAGIAGTLDAQERRIAVAATGDQEDAEISRVAARAPYILFFSMDGEFVETHKNPITRARGAGPAMAQWLSGEHADIIIAGSIGPNLAQALAARQIQGIEKSGRASAAVRELLE